MRNTLRCAVLLMPLVADSARELRFFEAKDMPDGVDRERVQETGE
jgi:hypothetical protein